jgi:hypothetical protein
MTHWHRAAVLGMGAALSLAASCSDDDSSGGGKAGSAGAAGDSGDASSCAIEQPFPAGDPEGHADPYGARAAGQARAGKLASASLLVQPAHGRQQVEVGDYVLANDKLAVVIEAPGLSDGYDTFGGKILAVDQIGDDGRPAGKSRYVETLLGMSVETIDAKSVSVINDGSDGKAAIVRAAGPLTAIPFLDGSLGVLFPRRYGLDAAFDYVLEPGSEKLVVRFGVANPSEEPVRFAIGPVTDEMHGFFHYNHNRLFAPGFGFAKPGGKLDWVGFVSPGEWSFAWRAGGGEQLSYELEVSGFQYTLGPGFEAAPCAITWTDHAEVIGGGPDADGLLEAIRSVDDAPPWRAVSGSVEDSAGAPVGGAWVHLLDADGKYLSRTQAAPDGSFAIRAPALASRLVASLRGYPSDEAALAADATSAKLVLGPSGKIHVTATELGTGVALPVRIQVIPKLALPATPGAFGLPDENGGRLHQEFSTTGDATLVVPEGEHRVIVSRGWEYELVDQTLTVAAGETVELSAQLERSVDSTGVMCADFHIHSFQSADSSDSIDLKVRSAIADGLEIPVASEHEWVIDYHPTIVALGLDGFAFGMPSEELTTFKWGHFGVVPLLPRPEAVNNGAVEWITKTPGELFAAVQALPENPVLIVNHPNNADFTGYFTQVKIDPETGQGKGELWDPNFDAIEVFQGADFEESRSRSVRDWFAILNGGKIAWAVGSSDSHHVRGSPVGYPRTCMPFGHDDPKQLTTNQVRDVLAVGKATISGGLYMTVEGPGGAGPGETVTGAGASADFTVTVGAASFVDATTLEVIVDGVTVKTEPLAPIGAGPGKKFVNVVSVPVAPAGSWVVFHAKGGGDLAPLHPGRHPFAVSNPVFLKP